MKFVFTKEWCEKHAELEAGLEIGAGGADRMANRKRLLDEIRDLYSAEIQLVEALPKMAQAASSPELQSAFKQHLDETRHQVSRL